MTGLARHTLAHIGREGALAAADRRLRNFVSERRRGVDNDLDLAEAIKRFEAAVVLGYFHDQSALEHQLDQNETEHRLRQIAGSEYPRVNYSVRARWGALIKGHAPQTNLEMFNAVAPSSGFFSCKAIATGCSAGFRPSFREARRYPPLGLVCAWQYLDRLPRTVYVASKGVDGIGIGRRFVPTDRSGRLLINYLGRAKTSPYFSVTDVLNGRVPKDSFKTASCS